MRNSFIVNSWLHACLVIIQLRIIFSECPFPPKHLPHGKFVFQSPKDANSTVASENYLLRFHCYRGYTRIGPRAIVCSQDRWSDVVPTCTKMRCLDPPVIQNGVMKLHAGVHTEPTLGSSVVYTCNDGFELVNKSVSTLHCTLKKDSNIVSWEGDTPACKARESCPDPGVSNDGQRTGSCCFVGNLLEFTCKEDYEIVGLKEIQCTATGNWSARRPLCKPLGDHCELPPLIPNGLVKGTKEGDYYRPYDEVEILCKPGYSYRGPSKFVMCEEEGEWDEAFGECTETFCERPDKPDNGTILELQTTNVTQFPYNFLLNYECDKGFRLVGGDSWRLCEARGWSGKTPSCEVIRCPNPGAPEHGWIEGSNFEIGSKVQFKCFSGFYIIGSFERFCMPNGQWTGELTRCDTESNYCPNPGIPINGYKNSSDYDMGDKIGFQCRPGYIQIGSEMRECMPDRTWSGKETTCLGPYDFDNSAQIRDKLRIAMSEKAEQQKKELMEFRKNEFASFHNGPMGRVLNLHHPGRLVLYFIFDVSGSVGRDQFIKSVEFAKAIVKRVGISDSGARVGALTFSSDATIEFLPVDYKTTADVMDALDRIDYTGGGTSASSALTLVKEECIPLTQAVLGKKGQKSVVFILTDGRANMGGDPQLEAKSLKEAGVEIYCIGITGDIKKDSLYKIASPSEKEQHVFILQDYATLSWLVQEITNGTVDYSQCGLGLETVGSQVHRGKIVGGKQADDPWPWMAALYFLEPGKADPSEAQLLCGGSIINKHFILTAAHCLYTPQSQVRTAKSVIVKLGLKNVKNESYVKEPEVQRLILHPRYRPGPDFDYDIALLQLKTPIEYNSYVRPLCLPPLELQPESPLYSSNESGVATGWGHEGIVPLNADIKFKTTENLKEIILPIQSRQRCRQSLENQRRANVSYFSERMFCAGNEIEGHDTCHGDSGGPLMQAQLNDEGYLFWTQVGIVSWGIGCGQRNSYGFYTHVQLLRPWIDDTIADVERAEA